MNGVPDSVADGDSLAPVMRLMGTSSRDGNIIFQANDQEVLYQGKTTLILRRDKVYSKVLLNTDEQSRGKMLSILEHERHVSNYLTAACPHRKVHSLHSDSVLGFSFDWVDGVSLSAWLKEHQQDKVSSADILMVRLNVAVAVAKSVASFHQAGVAHKNITSDNIVISFESKTCVATLIDLAAAVILSDEPTPEYAETLKMNDMKALGFVLYSVLGGKHQTDQVSEIESCYQESYEEAKEAEPTRSKRGRNDQRTGPNLPLYLVSLLFALTTPASDWSSYKNAQDVVTDLEEALKKPDIYLRPFNLSDDEKMSVQVPKDRFYGRLSEVSMIRQSIDLMKNNDGQPLAMSISGYAGTGKTTLLKQIADPIAESNGFVITCAFDRTVSPDTVLASAFDCFFGQSLPCSNSDINESIRFNIRETLDEHIDVLEEAIPNLGAFMKERREQDLGSDYAATEVTQRWAHLLSKLVYAIAKKSHPVALIFEDLHWADKDSLATIQKIMMDRGIKYCSYYISYRDSDTELMNKITEMKDNVQLLGFKLYNIRIGPMGTEAANSLVSETFCIPPSLSHPLSSVIYKKTGGIILFITNFLKSLNEIGYVRFSLSTCRWEFDINSINQLEMSSDIVQHLAERIMRLPKTVQAGMQIAAILGTTFDLETFTKASTKADTSNELSVEDFLYMVTECGFINENSPHQYTWSHDKIKEAAYSLIPLGGRESLHMLVGVKIYVKTDTEKIDDNIFIIVQNMNLGLRCLDQNHLKTELAHLNFVAGSKSAEQSAFNSALNYFMIGVGLLGDDWHVRSYKLGMRLFNAAVEALLVTGNVAMFKSTINIPITHARNIEDRLSATCTWVRFLASTSSIDEATAKCFSVLHDIGEDFPTEVTPQTIYMELMKTQEVMNIYSREDFSNLPKLTDPMKLWAMQFMQLACRVAFFRNIEFILLMGCRIVQISAAHGWCSISAFGLSTFGHGLMSVMNEIDEGHGWIKVALELVDTHLKSRELKVEMKMMYHVFIAFWKEPLQASREVLIDLSQEALLCGQVEFAMFSAFNSCRMSFVCGQNIVKGEVNCASLANRMAQLRQVQSSLSLASHHSMLLTLMNAQDTSKAFTMLDEHIYSEDELLEFCLKKEKLGVVHGINLNRLFLAYSFKQYDEAASMAKLYNSRKMMRFLDVYAVLFEGLTALQLARRDDDSKHKWIEIVEQAIESFKTWENHSKWNFENKLLLLQAELHDVREQFDEAEEKYKASISSAQKHRFVHEEGIALNLFGEFYKKLGMEKDAKIQLVAARHCYEQWGATALVNLIEL